MLSRAFPQRRAIPPTHGREPPIEHPHQVVVLVERQYAGLDSRACWRCCLPVLPSKVHAQSALDGFDPERRTARVRVVVVQPDGKILIGGDFTTLSPNGVATVTRNHIARLNPDGTLDTAFNPNANGVVYAIALQADGKILAGGFSRIIGGQPRNRIARLDATTGLPDSFDPNANCAA